MSTDDPEVEKLSRRERAAAAFSSDEDIPLPASKEEKSEEIDCFAQPSKNSAKSSPKKGSRAKSKPVTRKTNRRAISHIFSASDESDGEQKSACLTSQSQPIPVENEEVTSSEPWQSLSQPSTSAPALKSKSKSCSSSFSMAKFFPNDDRYKSNSDDKSAKTKLTSSSSLSSKLSSLENERKRKLSDGPRVRRLLTSPKKVRKPGRSEEKYSYDFATL